VVGKGQGGKEVEKWGLDRREWMVGKTGQIERESWPSLLNNGVGPHISRDSDVKRGHML